MVAFRKCNTLLAGAFNFDYEVALLCRRVAAQAAPKAQSNRGFNVGTNEVVIAQIVPDSGTYTLTLNGLPVEPTSITLTSAAESVLSAFCQSYSSGAETVTIAPGAGARYLQMCCRAGAT